MEMAFVANISWNKIFFLSIIIISYYKISSTHLIYIGMEYLQRKLQDLNICNQANLESVQQACFNKCEFCVSATWEVSKLVNGTLHPTGAHNDSSERIASVNWSVNINNGKSKANRNSVSGKIIADEDYYCVSCAREHKLGGYIANLLLSTEHFSAEVQLRRVFSQHLIGSICDHKRTDLRDDCFHKRGFFIVDGWEQAKYQSNGKLERTGKIVSSIDWRGDNGELCSLSYKDDYYCQDCHKYHECGSRVFNKILSLDLRDLSITFRKGNFKPKYVDVTTIPRKMYSMTGVVPRNFLPVCLGADEVKLWRNLSVLYGDQTIEWNRDIDAKGVCYCKRCGRKNWKTSVTLLQSEDIHCIIKTYEDNYVTGDAKKKPKTLKGDEEVSFKVWASQIYEDYEKEQESKWVGYYLFQCPPLHNAAFHRHVTPTGSSKKAKGGGSGKKGPRDFPSTIFGEGESLVPLQTNSDFDYDAMEESSSSVASDDLESLSGDELDISQEGIPVDMSGCGDHVEEPLSENTFSKEYRREFNIEFLESEETSQATEADYDVAFDLLSKTDDEEMVVNGDATQVMDSHYNKKAGVVPDFSKGEDPFETDEVCDASEMSDVRSMVSSSSEEFTSNDCSDSSGPVSDNKAFGPVETYMDILSDHQSWSNMDILSDHQSWSNMDISNDNNIDYQFPNKFYCYASDGDGLSESNDFDEFAPDANGMFQPLHGRLFNNNPELKKPEVKRRRGRPRKDPSSVVIKKIRRLLTVSDVAHV